MIQTLPVACYCRVSTENQIENYSIDEQKARLHAFCKAKGWRVGETFVDAGYSGGNLERPALKSLLERVRQNRYSAVVVYKLDRLSRSQKDTLYLIEDVFKKSGTDFVSVCENLDTGSPFGKAMIGILSVFAQLEKEQITERFTMGRIGRAKNGLFHGGGSAPTGYDYINGSLVVNEFKAAQVREVFGRFLRGESIHAIQKAMNERYGGWSSHTLVRAVLKNPVYIGKVRFGGKEYDGEHSPIISAEMFCEVQRLLSERPTGESTVRKTPFRAGYLLSGLLFCGSCGARYHANHGSYKCYSRSKCDKRYIIDQNCKSPDFDINELDLLVCGEIKRAALDLSRLPKSNADKTECFAVSAEKRLAEIRTQSDRLLELYQNAQLPLEGISERLRLLEKERVALEDRLSEVSSRSAACSTNDELLKLYGSFPDGCDTALGRAFIASVIEKIIIEPNGDIELHWRV